MLKVKVKQNNASNKPPAQKIVLNANHQQSHTVNVGNKPPAQKIIVSANKPQPNNINRGTRTADHFNRQNLRTQIRNRPDTYIRTKEKVPRTVRILNITDPKNPYMHNVNTDLPLGVESCYDEVLANAADAIEFLREDGGDPEGCKITMDTKRITIWNSGHLPVEIKTVKIDDEVYQEYVPQMVFGTLLTSGNYDDSKRRTLRGRNGYGAKLTNIFSTRFEIDIGDGLNGKRYQQLWENEMLIRHEPVITPYTGDNYVQVSYDLDFNYFGYEEYPEVAFHLFARMALEASFTSKEKVVFNGINLHYPLIENYAKLFQYVNRNNEQYEQGKLPKHIVSYKWGPNVQTVDKKGTKYPTNHKAMPTAEVIVLDTPHNGKIISFVNGAECVNGGAHVNDALNSVCSGVIKEINDIINHNKDKDKDKSAYVGNLNVSHVKEHLTIIIAYRVDKPIFEDQTKTKFVKPVQKFEIDPKLVKNTRNWELADVLYEDVQRRQHDKMSRGKSGKRRRRHGGAKATRANLAGGPQSLKCTAFIVEGDSASSFPEKFIEYMGPTARDYYGTFLLGGKPLNTRNASIFKIAGNKIIQDLLDFLGIQDGVDYSNPANRTKLNYGKVIILADSDADGSHIAGLVTGDLDDRARSLLQAYGVGQAVNGQPLQGTYLYTMFTRYIVLNNGMSFRTEEDYELWKKQDPRHSTIKGRYLKGLASNEDDDILFEAKNPCIVGLQYDEHAFQSLELAFNSKYTNQRKQWILNHQLQPGLSNQPFLPISTFVQTQVVKHPKDNVARMIPKMMDMFKESQRKLFQAALDKFNYGNKNAAIKVSQLANYTSENMGYHHGEDGLSKTLIWMAQDIIGRNNLPLFIRKGQFGTRTKLGKKNNAGSPRYIRTALDPLATLIFRKEDAPLLKMRESEGDTVEPMNFMPVIKMLCNGAEGVATGWSTYIPNYDPLCEALWLMCRLSGNVVCEMIPWYYGFKGMIIVKPRNAEKKNKKLEENDESDKEKEKDEDAEDEDDEDEHEDIDKDVCINKNTKLTMVTKGNFTPNMDGSVHVTELPIGVGTKVYEEKLDHMEEEGIITGWKSYSGSDINIHIYGMKNPNHKNLHLTKSFGMSNFILLDNQGIPRKYENVHDIMEEFFHIRLAGYVARKEWMLNDMGEKIKNLNYKIQFLELIIKKEISPVGMDKTTLKDMLSNKYQIPWEPVKETKFTQATKQGIEKLKKQVQDILLKIQQLQATTAENMWMSDLKEFIEAYCKQYNRSMPMYQPRNDKAIGKMCREGDGPIMVLQGNVKINPGKSPILNNSNNSSPKTKIKVNTTAPPVNLNTNTTAPPVKVNTNTTAPPVNLNTNTTAPPVKVNTNTTAPSVKVNTGKVNIKVNKTNPPLPTVNIN